MNVNTSRSVKITIGYKHSREKKNPKTISCCILISQLISGFDFGFSKLFNENVQGFLRHFTVLQVFTYNAIFLVPAVITNSVSWMLFPLLEYFLNAIILLCYKKYTIYNFLCDISEFSILSKKDIYILNIIYMTDYIFFVFTKILLLISFNGSDMKIDKLLAPLPSVYVVLFTLHYIIVDLVTMIQIVILYYVYCSMKNLKLRLVLYGQKLNVTSEQYKAIVDIREKIKPLSDSLVRNIIFFSLINTKKYV